MEVIRDMFVAGDVIEFIRPVHMSCAFLTILFFVARGLLMMRNPAFISGIWVRRTAQAIDTVLLLSGAALIWMTGLVPWQEPWLGMKLSLLVVYILLGMCAFHWAERRNIKVLAWLMALMVFACMVLIAQSKKPWPF
ncbi:MAG: SirB2 family protein [Mariprofundus sp.]